MRDNVQSHRVRLADGSWVRTVGCVVVLVLFGKVHYCGNFFVLSCDVPLILGMEFLRSMKPIIDFENRRVAILHNG